VYLGLLSEVEVVEGFLLIESSVVSMLFDPVILTLSFVVLVLVDFVTR